MLYTSAEAAKLLRKLNEEHKAVVAMELKSREFNAALGENVESVRPEYDYKAVQKQLEALEQSIRTVKHALNQFNVSHEVPGFGMTIDQMLVYIPQLGAQKEKLERMAGRLPKEREQIRPFSGQSSVIDYTYANYDIEAVKADLLAVSDKLAKAQIALDVLNNSEKMEIELS